MSVYFTKEHEWVKLEGNRGTVGISEYAAHQLGDVTYVELPQAGKSVKQFGNLCSIESVKAASDIYSPISGTVVEVNGELDTTPEVVNESAEEKGWMAVLEISDPSEVSTLLTREQYEQYLRSLA